MNRKVPAVLLLASVLALGPAAALAQHVDVGPGGYRWTEADMVPVWLRSAMRVAIMSAVKDTMNSDVNITTVAGTRNNVTEVGLPYADF